MAPDWKKRLLNIFLPRTCAACRLDLPPSETRPACARCLQALEPLVRCQRTSRGLEVWAAFAYRRPVPELLHGFKYRGRLPIGRFLGDSMGSLLALLPLGEIDAVVPVPLHPARFRERGFNQAAVLAQSVASAAGAPVVEMLRRFRNTEPQWRLNRTDRARNLSDAFRLESDDKNRFNFPNANTIRPREEFRVLLIDDVCTTGGTLEGCAGALRLGGYRNVRAYVLAQD